MGFSFFPKDVKFFDHFKEQNRKLKKAVSVLDDLFENFQDIDTRYTEINIIEAEANAIARRIATELSSTFITPIDREDIHQINVTQETLINIIRSAATRVALFQFADIHYPLKRVVKNLRRMIEDAGEVINLLAKGKPAHAQIENIKSHKYECEMLLVVGLGEIYDTPDEDPKTLLHILKWTHLYNRIEQAVERTEELADVLEGVLLKNA